MNERRAFRYFACFPLVATGAAMPAVAQPVSIGEMDGAWTFHHENVMGTSMQVTVRAADGRAADAAETALLAAIDRQSSILSAWDGTSELSRWMRTRGEAVKVSPELMEVLGLFDHWRGQTGGALDASVAVATQLWERASAEGRQPTQSEIANAIAAMQQRHWALDVERGTATRLSGTPLVLASFTKCYVAGNAADAALRAGASGVMLNVGGDVVVRGSLTQVVNIADPMADAEGDRPLDQVVVRDGAVATSGSYRRGFTTVGASMSGRPEFSHLLDPRTAMPVGHVTSSTVIARDASTAGALATAMSVMGVDESRELARAKGAEYLLVLQNGDHVASEGWQQYRMPALREVAYALLQARPGAASAPPPVAPWNQMELAINLEIPSKDFRARRPYVAVWVENDRHVVVRTIALWYDKQRFLHELRTYTKDNDAAIMSGRTVGSATRSPGKYTLKWDGKDDTGKLVAPGKYTIVIEASREHGGLQTQAQELDFSGKPAQHTFAPGAELGAVTLDYRKQ